jgi:Putative peptidoglycan binding domain
MGRTLHVGSSGPEVRAVQLELNRLFKTGLNPDGVYGHNTATAVRHFQQRFGFPKPLQDGIFGPKTFVALFGLFNLTVSADLKPKADPPSSGASTVPVTHPNDPAPVQNPKQAVAAAPKEADDPLTRMQGTFQLGGQYSKRDGKGEQAQLGFTFRSPYFLPHSKPNAFYHYLRIEGMVAPTIGIPYAGGSIFTGQLNLTVTPVTDWLVYHKIWHFLTPSLGAFGQAPINHPSLPGKPDPSSGKRLGGIFGLELMHVDVVKDRLSIGLSGQEAGYWDFKSRKVFWDPSVMIFLQFNLGDGWLPYKSR